MMNFIRKIKFKNSVKSRTKFKRAPAGTDRDDSPRTLPSKLLMRQLANNEGMKDFG